MRVLTNPVIKIMILDIFWVIHFVVFLLLVIVDISGTNVKNSVFEITKILIV